MAGRCIRRRDRTASVKGRCLAVRAGRSRHISHSQQPRRFTLRDKTTDIGNSALNRGEHARTHQPTSKPLSGGSIASTQVRTEDLLKFCIASDLRAAVVNRCRRKIVLRSCPGGVSDRRRLLRPRLSASLACVVPLSCTRSLGTHRQL